MSELDAEVVELLRRSVEQQGQLLPVVKDQYGNILSGRHRKAADPNWRETTVVVADELDRELKIVHFNVQRRPSQEETAARLLKIAKILERRGVPIADICPQIAKLVPYSERHVRRLLPDKYKHVEMRRELGKPKIAEVVPQNQHLATSDKPMPKPLTADQPVECQSCHVHTWFPYALKNGQILCSLCFEKEWKDGNIAEDDLLPELPVQQPEKPKPKPEVKVVKPPAKDRWEHRKAQMQPQHSKMELAVLEKLKAEGITPVVTERSFCLQSTTPDFYLPKHNVAIYLDGKPHEGREDRDEALRELLAKRHGLKVVSIKYAGFSEAEVNRVLDEIKEVSGC